MTRYKRLCIKTTDIEARPGVREAITLYRGDEYTTTSVKNMTLTVIHGGKEYPLVLGSLFAGPVLL